LIESLLPGPSETAEVFGLRRDVELFPEESRAIANSVEKRRAEFTSVRGCAREALSRLDIPAAPLVPGEGGAPRWPGGAAAVARKHEVAALGIDAEPNISLPDGVLDAISVPEDLVMLTTLPNQGVAWDRLLFSAKESVYKTWFPLTGLWLGFEDVAITFGRYGTFNATFLVPGPLVQDRRVSHLSGRWAAEGGILATAIALPIQ
jgi:4'-phosphopantetheinyl transferase EntD